MSENSWYGAKCVFVRTDAEDSANHVYEERVVLFRATSFDEATNYAETEARAYVNGDEAWTYTGFVNVFQLVDETIGEGAEVYSLMRTSKLCMEQYLNHFYDTGEEHSMKSE